MSSPDFDHVQDCLAQWKIALPSGPNLTVQVLRRIRAEDAADVGKPSWGEGSEWLGQLARRSVLLGSMALAVLMVVVCGLLFWKLKQVGRPPMDSYLSAIDPVFRLTQANQNPSRQDSLLWLRRELQLTPTQFTKLAALHADYGRVFAEHFARLQLEGSSGRAI